MGRKRPEVGSLRSIVWPFSAAIAQRVSLVMLLLVDRDVIVFS